MGRGLWMELCIYKGVKRLQHLLVIDLVDAQSDLGNYKGNELTIDL